MHADLPESLLERCSQFVEARAGLHFPRERWPDLVRALGVAALDLGIEGAGECARRVLAPHAEPEAIDALVSRLTVGETYFFRDRAAFSVLERRVLPEMIARGRRGSVQRLRIWSAGCCTGEEPYSIAMAVSRALPDPAAWEVSVLGTDINPRFLQKAEAASYSRWSFRGGAEEFQPEFFQRVDADRFEVIPRIRKMVTFACVNLVEDVYPSLLNQTNAMDVIFCRNVLMYFSPEQAKKVVGNLRQALVEEGWLFPAGAEASRELFGEFAVVELPDAVVYRKTSPNPASAGRAAPPWLAVPPPAAVIDGPPVAPPKRITAVPLPAERARQLANAGRLADALAACDEALLADKLAPAHHYLRGLILQEQGEHDAATAALGRALYLDPEFILAHFALGNARRREGRSREAARCFDHARTLLRRCEAAALLPESDGLTAGRLLAILEGTA